MFVNFNLFVFSVPQPGSISERQLLGWAVCSAQEMLWRRWWSYHWRSALAIHHEPHKLCKHNYWRKITLLKKSYFTKYCGWKTLQTNTEDRGTTAIIHWILRSRHSQDTGYSERHFLPLIFQSLVHGLWHLSNSWFGDRIACILSYRKCWLLNNK